jgi:L-alanine-DL-glutamate epimerase-like enolase superfamily enzyme
MTAAAAAAAEATNPQSILVRAVDAFAYTIPTDQPEADGTFTWDSTTLVVAQVQAADETGLGYSYTSAAAAPLIVQTLAAPVKQTNAFDPPAAWRAMNAAVRNIGRGGLVAMAISAVDTALWDLKSRLLGLPLARLFGCVREKVAIYGSGGFTSYSDQDLRSQLAGWVRRDGCAAVKMKIGTEPGRDPERVRQAKEAIGDADLYVDANGAYEVKQALALADQFADDAGVRWFEEPVSSDDLQGLALLRRRTPAGMDIAAGEYGQDLDYFRHMLGAEAVDVQQADVTRCGGYTGLLQIAALCEAHHIDLSAHCAPSLHLPAACASPRLRNQEWFHDHVRIEQRFFDGAPRPHDGLIRPDFGRPGNGLDFKFKDAERYRVA